MANTETQPNQNLPSESAWKGQRTNRFDSVPSRIIRRFFEKSSDPNPLPEGDPEQHESVWHGQRTNRFEFWPANLIMKLFK